MALRVVSRFYPTYAEAVQAVADLTIARVPNADISLIESEDDARLPPGVSADAAQAPAITGATIGAGIGGGLGVLVGVGAIAIPVLEPVAALGWLLSTLIGTVIGALLGAAVGAVTQLGVTNWQAHSFAQGLRRGDHLVMVRVEEHQVAETEAMMARTYAHVPPMEAPLPPQPELTLADERAAIFREEERIQRDR